MAHLQAEGACQVRLEAFNDIGPVSVRQRSRVDHVVGEALDHGGRRSADDALAHIGDARRNVPAPRKEVQYLQFSASGWGDALPQQMPQWLLGLSLDLSTKERRLTMAPSWSALVSGVTREQAALPC